MCWGSDPVRKAFAPLDTLFRTGKWEPPGSTPSAPATPSTPSTPASSPDILRRLILAKTGAIPTFDQRTREAGLGTSITTSALGSVKDPTRQS